MSHRCFFETSIPDFISLSQLCKTLCDHMEYSTPGFPVHHQTPQFAQTRIYLIDDAIQPSHSLLSPLLVPFNLSEHQDLFQEVNSLHPVAKVSRFSGSASVQFSSVTQSCLTLCDPMNRSMPGLPVHHQPPEFTQTHAHRVGNAFRPSHPLSSTSPPAPNPSKHQGLFQ